jgi:hypothetical protein
MEQDQYHSPSDNEDGDRELTLDDHVTNYADRLPELIRDTIRGNDAMSEAKVACTIECDDNRYPSTNFGTLCVIRHTAQKYRDVLGKNGVHTYDGYFFEDSYVKEKLEALIKIVCEGNIVQAMGEVVKALGGVDERPVSAVCNFIAQQRSDELKEGGVEFFTERLGSGFGPL